MGDKKTDMDRVGLFQEMGYVTIKDPYKAAGSGMLKMLMYCMSREMHKDFIATELKLLESSTISAPVTEIRHHISSWY